MLRSSDQPRRSAWFNQADLHWFTPPRPCDPWQVPSPLHDAFVTFFRTHIDCALQLAIQAGLELPAPRPLWHVIPGDFGDPGRRGRDYQADVVLAAFPPDIPSPPPEGTRALATLILEPQLGFDTEKGVSWLVYRAGVASRHGDGGQWVLAICPKPNVLARFREVFPFNPELRPILIGAGDITPVLDAAVADANPPWAALSAALHARSPFAFQAAVVALRACTRLPANERRCTFTLVCAGLPRNVMQQVRREVPEETRHELTEYEREGAWYLDGRDEGLAEGRRSSLLLLLASRDIQLDPDQRAKIDTCTDAEQLQRWFERALRATSIDAVLTNDG
jgi:hypothetical protein